jgi:hypothetical protein
MPPPTDFGAKPVDCNNCKELRHWVLPQKDSNSCGARALRMALIEMGLGDSTPTADHLLRYMIIGKLGVTSRVLRSAVDMAMNGYVLKEIGSGGAFGKALREGDDLEAPIIAYCDALKDGQKAGGHWVTVARRNKKGWRSCDTFCVLDPASGKAYTVPISKAGVGRFSFQATDVRPDAEKARWDLILKEGLKFVKA